MPKKPVFAYWHFRGIAESIRYLLHYAGVDFEDKRYLYEEGAVASLEWLNDKPNLGLDFPNLPYYIDDHVKLSQSNTILRYLAEKHGLGGRTEMDQLRVSLAEQQIDDLRGIIRDLFYSLQFEQKKAKFVENVPAQIKLVSDFLDGRKYLVGEYVTYVDFMAYEALEIHHYFIPDILKGFPNLERYQERIRQLPQLQPYLKSEKYFRWPIASFDAHFGGRGPEPKIH